MADTLFKSDVFETEVITLADTKETIVRGGRDKFDLLPKAFEGIKQIGIIGWGSQGPAQAQNLKESLEGTDTKVVIGLRKGSTSMEKACVAGFTRVSGSLDDMWNVVAESDMVILLISDAAQVENYREILKKMKPGATLGLSHGFLLGHMESVGHVFRPDINVIGVCPKGMGPSVRRLYVQGKEVNGAGINCSFAVQQDIDGRATDQALAWAIAIGAPYVFKTSLKREFLSDLTGERGILLGAVHGISEALYRYLVMEKGLSEEDAFCATVESITGPISSTISHKGIIGLYNQLTTAEKLTFEMAYSAAYHPAMDVHMEVYGAVESGDEIRSVIRAVDQHKIYPFRKIDGTRMWHVGEYVRKELRSEEPYDLPFGAYALVAGVYCAVMMSQVDLFIEKGHCLSEICNESVIEAVDSLNPYMHFRGVSYMVDNCSTTARLGSRKWAPKYDYNIMQQALVDFENKDPSDKDLIGAFKNHMIHDVLATVATMRPSVDISLSE